MSALPATPRALAAALSAEAFRGRADALRELGRIDAEFAEACMRFDHGDTDGARTLLHRLRTELGKLRDKAALKHVWLSLALCEIRRGDGASARHWLDRAGAARRDPAHAPVTPLRQQSPHIAV